MAGKFYKNVVEAIRDETNRIKGIIREQRSSQKDSGSIKKRT
ncbi:MAG: hypothetical protein AAE986_05675 [Thermoplasmataceae archaeon]